MASKNSCSDNISISENLKNIKTKKKLLAYELRVRNHGFVHSLISAFNISFILTYLCKILIYLVSFAE